MGSRRLLGFAAVVLLLIAAWPCAVAAADSEYTLAVVPQYNQRTIYEIWAPIAARLSEAIGRPIRLVGAAGIPSFEQGLREGRYDFAYMNPYDVLKANHAQGYIPLVRDRASGLRGVMVVSKRSELTSVADLDGRTVAFPAPNALGATLLMRAELRDKIGVDVVPRFVGSHSSAFLQVTQGLTAAGAGVEQTLREQPAAIRGALRVIYRTREVPAHAICAHPRVSASVQAALRDAFIGMGNDATGRAMLAPVPITTPGTAEITDYRFLGELGLERFYEQP